MLTLIKNQEKKCVQFEFQDFFTSASQFTTCFELDECEAIAKDLLALVKEIRKKSKDENSKRISQ